MSKQFKVIENHIYKHGKIDYRQETTNWKFTYTNCSELGTNEIDRRNVLVTRK